MAFKIHGIRRRVRQKTGEIILLAWGRADDDTDHVTGTLRLGGDPGRVVDGMQIFFQRESPHRWLLLFRNAAKGDFSLTVTEMNGTTAVKSDTRTFERFFTIDDPLDGAHVNNDRNDLVADGDTDTSIVSAPITFPLPDGRDHAPDQLFSDPTGLQFWSAQYPPLTLSGAYTITVTDSTSATEHITVYIDP